MRCIVLQVQGATRYHSAMSVTVQKGVRIPVEWVPRIEALGKRLSPHVELSEAAVLRKALGAGLDALEAEFGSAVRAEPAKQEGASSPARKPKR